MLNKYSYWFITFTTCVLWLHKSNFQTFHCKSIKICRLCHQCQWSHRRANGLYNCLYNIHSTGPETSEVVLVSAAHCNFICKVIASCDHLIRIYFFFFKGQRQQRCGDLLLPWIPSPRIVPSQRTLWWPTELLLWEGARTSPSRAIRIGHCLFRVLLGNWTRAGHAGKGAGAEDLEDHQLPRLPTGHQQRQGRESQGSLCRRRHCCLQNHLKVKEKGQGKHEGGNSVTCMSSSKKLQTWEWSFCRLVRSGALLQSLNNQHPGLRERVPQDQNSQGMM